MSRARKLFEAHIESLQREAKEKGISLSDMLLWTRSMYPPETAASQPSGLAALLEQSHIESARALFYEWLANLLLDAPRATQKQRQAGVRRGMEKQLEASKKIVQILEYEIDLIREGTPEHHINKRIVQQTNQLFERMQHANEQRRSLITLSQGMDEAIRQMRDPSSMQAAMDRSAHLDRAYEMLGTADHAINTLWHVLTVFTVITCQPDRKRTGPGVARLRDGMLRQADSSIEFVERCIHSENGGYASSNRCRYTINSGVSRCAGHHACDAFLALLFAH